MKVILLRHGAAEDMASSDFERKLVAKGREQAAAVGRFYKKNKLNITRIISSPFLRAQEMASIVAREIGGDIEVEEDKSVGCGMRAEDALSLMRDCDDNDTLLLVGHEPDMGRLTSFFTGTSGVNFAFKKACSAVFEIYSFGSGGGVLEAFIPVRMLK